MNRPSNAANRDAFLKRWSQVRILPGTPLSPKDLSDAPSPGGPPIPTENRVTCTNSVHAPGPLPEWLAVARAHLREHYPHDGLSESVLWALYARGFEMAVTIGDDADDSPAI